MYNFGQSIHFIGIGGVGMAGIAEVLVNLGYRVTGSDLREGELISHLRQLGASVEIGHRPDNILPETGVVVVSSAVPPENVELLKAKALGLPIIPRAEMLAELMRMKYGVAIAGSHGKTTTTSMCAKVLRDVGHDPTVIIGGRILSQQSGARLGCGDYLVAEADESDGSFCLLRPAIAVVTNIDKEHLSHYGSIEGIEKAFLKFMSSVPFYGVVVACGDDAGVQKLLPKIHRRSVRYGLDDENYISAVNIRFEDGRSKYTLTIDGAECADVSVPVSGSHMVCNSLAALAVAVELGAEPQDAALSLADFPGVSRRTEVVGSYSGVLIVDDYAHHPSEITATLKALRRSWLPHHAAQCKSELGRLVLLFEPHRYSRTEELLEEFASAFEEADEVFISDIYPAGEKPIAGVSSKKLIEVIKNPNAQHVACLSEALPEILQTLRPGDILATLGAGSIGSIAREAAAKLG